MCNLLRINASCISVVVLQYTVLFSVKTYKVSQLFSIWVALFLNFREIEPTVSYKLFLIKKMRVLYCRTTDLQRYMLPLVGIKMTDLLSN